MQEVQFKSCATTACRPSATAVERYRAGDAEGAVEVLREYLDSLNNTNLEAGRLALLKRPIESRLEQFKTLKMRDELEKLQASKHETFESMQQKRQLAEQMKQEKVTELMKQYPQLLQGRKYQDAEMVACAPTNSTRTNVVPTRRHVATSRQRTRGREAQGRPCRVGPPQPQ